MFTIFFLLQNPTCVEIVLIIIEAYMMQYNKNIVVDLDGTLLDFKFPYIGEPIKGSVEAINTLSNMGYKITIYSCRNNPKLFSSSVFMNQNLKDTEAALKKYGFKEFTIDKGDTGKPCALYYVDDSGIEFNGWETLLSGHSFYPGIAVSIGIEKCIIDENNNLIEGAADALNYLWKTGINVILTSVNKDITELEKILKEYKLPYDYLDSGKEGKPICGWYIEHNMIPFKGIWQDVLKRL